MKLIVLTADADLEAASEMRDRQSKGYFTMCEVAQILADTYSLDANALLKTMKADYHVGEITIRSRGTEAPVLPEQTLRDFYDLMFPDDIRAMLKHWGWSRTFPFPVGEQTPKAPSVSPAGVSAVTAKKWTTEKLSELQAYRAGHTMTETAAHFGISESRIRKLDPREKPKPEGHSVFTHRPK